jgi:hypothetical protein
VARTRTKKIQVTAALTDNIKAEGIPKLFKPPDRKSKQKRVEIRIILQYSPRKNSAKGSEE